MKKFMSNLTLTSILLLNNFSFADVVSGLGKGPVGGPHGKPYAAEVSATAIRRPVLAIFFDWILPLATIIAIIIVVTLIIIKIKKNKK